VKYQRMDRGAQADLLAKLGEMPRYLAEKFTGLTSEAATRRSPNDGFSPVEQCWHLVDLEREGFAMRMRRLRSEERPVLPISTARRSRASGTIARNPWWTASMRSARRAPKISR
jgi:hypothetical protein